MNERLLPIGHGASEVEGVVDQKCDRRQCRRYDDAHTFHVTLSHYLRKRSLTPESPSPSARLESGIIGKTSWLHFWLWNCENAGVPYISLSKG